MQSRSAKFIYTECLCTGYKPRSGDISDIFTRGTADLDCKAAPNVLKIS